MTAICAALGVATAIVFLVALGVARQHEGRPVAATREATVITVLDGDTLTVAVDGQDERVRLLGSTLLS